MTFTFIIMDSLYIMRNLLMIFFLMVVFWTNLGNCEGELPTEISTITNDPTTTPPADDFCGTDNITLLEGTLHNLTNPSYRYFNIGNRDCIWFISGTPDYNIVIKFYELAINPYNYTLSVGYGNDPDNTTSTIAKLYNESRLVSIESENGWIRFETSHEEYYIGFSAVLLTADVSNVSFPCHNNSLICEGICLPESWICDNVTDCLPVQDKYNCDASPCHEPAPPDDLVFHSPDFAGEMYPNGTEIMYDCPDGLDLNGHMTAVCLYGVWTYEDAYCTASPCHEPAPPDDLVIHSPDFAEGEMYPNGTEIMYDCPDGWDFNGKMTAVCLYGVWTYEDAYCTASTCDEPAPPDDLVFHSPDFAEGETYAHGTEIMYDCPDGWDLNGHMTAVCLYRVWTYEDANCTASSCDEPAPPDDLVFHSPDFAEGEMYANGTEIMYDCPDGLNLNGHMTAVCLYGVWTYEDAYCTGTDVCDKYTQCFYDEARMHSTVSCNYKTAGNTAHPCYGDGSIITCSCKSDKFQLSSPDNSYLCRPDKWEDGLYDLKCSTGTKPYIITKSIIVITKFTCR